SYNKIRGFSFMRFNRFRLKKRHSTPPKQYVFLVTVIIFIIIILFSLWLIDRGIRPALMDIAELKTTEFATRTINSAVKSTEQMNFDDLIEMEMDNNGNVATLGWKSDVVNEALRTATERAEYFLYGMNKGKELDVDDPDLDPIEFGDSVEELADKDPTVVANLGPKVPVHFEIVGNLQSDVVHEVKEFGVNAALFEIYIPVTVNMQIVIPFSTTTTEISTKVFVDSRVIMGDVPEFFSDG